MTWTTEYQMGSDELRRLNTSGEFNATESDVQEACVSQDSFLKADLVVNLLPHCS